MNKPMGTAVIGYGGAFNMGREHLKLGKEAGMSPSAVCDTDALRLVSAQDDFPGIATYTSVDELLRDPAVDLVTIITPHDSHAALAIQAANAGKHVVVEKPMAITVDQAARMIDAAKASNVTLSVYHNRRHDGDFLAIKEMIESGKIGDVFQIQAGMGGYHKPQNWWRSDKAISGGLMYDWGAHFIDWILNLMPDRKVTQVTGILHNHVWTDISIEDHGQILMVFDNGASAEFTISEAMAIPMYRWRVLGTKGGILMENWDSKNLKLVRHIDGQNLTGEVPFKQATNTYYKDLAAYFAGEKPLQVTAESSRRIIAIIEAAEKSSKSGKSEPVPYEV